MKPAPLIFALLAAGALVATFVVGGATFGAAMFLVCVASLCGAAITSARS